MTTRGRLLVVDDAEDVVLVLSEYFTRQKYQVETAANGHEAVAALERGGIDAVLLDMNMPELDGLGVLRRLRELDIRVPVIMVTANEDLAQAQQCLQLGAVGYVEKPFDFVALGRSVAAALAGK